MPIKIILFDFIFIHFVRLLYKLEELFKNKKNSF